MHLLHAWRIYTVTQVYSISYVHADTTSTGSSKYNSLHLPIQY